MIPKIIHQTYKTKNLPELYKPYQKSLLALHPNWEYKLWSDEENDIFLRNIYPDFYSVYMSIPVKIMKIDFIRYVYLYHFGGLYLDLDYEMLKPFDIIQYSIVLPRESEDFSPIYLGNSIIASEPKHEFWQILLNNIANTIPKLSEYIDEETVINTTGPGMVTKVYNSIINKFNIYIPPRYFFNPPIPKNKISYNKLKNEKVSYGIHYCYGSWRSLTFYKKLLNKINKFLFLLKKGNKK